MPAWPAQEEQGNILHNDKKFITLLYEMHEDYFADYAWRGKREQYGRMLREYPQLLQRIALKDLAAYLFLTPQSLSRIRAGVK